jgi:hypothetical protein
MQQFPLFKFPLSILRRPLILSSILQLAIEDDDLKTGDHSDDHGQNDAQWKQIQ